MSSMSHIPHPSLSGDSARPGETLSYLGLCCKSLLKWVLTVIPSCCLGPELSWEDNLMIPSLINRGVRNTWKCVLKEISKGCIVYQVAFPRVDLFTRVDWPLQFITYAADINHISALRDARAVIISQQPSTTGHMSVAPLLWLPECFIERAGFLYNKLPPLSVDYWLLVFDSICLDWTITYSFTMVPSCSILFPYLLSMVPSCQRYDLLLGMHVIVYMWLLFSILVSCLVEPRL